MLLERDLQSACVLAGIGGLLVDLGLLDNEEADTEYDQVQVGKRLSWRHMSGQDHDWMLIALLQIRAMGFRKDEVFGQMSYLQGSMAKFCPCVRILNALSPRQRLN
jgi:hypothetical protein